MRTVTRAVSIARVAASIERFGDRFTTRCFTPAERAYCDARRRTVAEHYAARWVAKLAARQLLGGGRLIDIEVVRDGWGAPSFAVHADTARRPGADRLLLSLTHAEDRAIAMVARP